MSQFASQALVYQTQIPVAEEQLRQSPPLSAL